jgi:hypothetical protein
MGGKNDAPDPPDYSKIAAASEKAAEYSYKISKEQLAWAKEKYASDNEIAGKVIDAALERQSTNDANAAKDRARYEGIYQPLEDQLAKDAEDYSNPDRLEENAAKAQADVSQQFDQSRQRALQNLQSYGVDPSSLRYAALDRGANVSQAAAESAAGNQSRQQDQAIGRALRSEAINVGRGYPGQIAGTYGTALQSGNQGINSALATTASGASSMGTGLGWGQAGNQSLNTWGNTLNTGYQNELSAWQANQNSSSGIGGLLGTGLGVAASFMEDGGKAGDVTSEGKVPAHASPSKGKAIDDVPARLNVGEFVTPNDVVAWKGEEFFQNLIKKSRDDKKRATAKPEYAIAPPQRPTFDTTRSALPV